MRIAYGLCVYVRRGREDGKRLLNLWSRKEYFDADKLVDTFDNIPLLLNDLTGLILRYGYICRNEARMGRARVGILQYFFSALCIEMARGHEGRYSHPSD